MDHIDIGLLNLLHWEFDDSSITPEVLEHSHGYWQMELCVSGRIDLCSEGGVHALYPGEGVFLPPGVFHGFHNRGAYYSFKFVLPVDGATEARPMFFAAGTLTEWALANFAERRKAAGILLEISDNRTILEALLIALLRQAAAYGTRHNAPREPALAAQLRHWVGNAGRQPGVEAAAEYCGMSVAQLKYRFAREMAAVHPETRNFSVKAFLDEATLELIDRYLTFTDVSPSQIAERIGFNNVYTFSRFCRRLTGMPPGKRRRELKMAQIQIRSHS